MKIKEKIGMDREGLTQNGPINIVAFGDSVTHGAVASGEINYETVYWNRLRKKILAIRDYVPVNVINAGIGGITAAGSVDRMDRDVFDHHPDLVIICFGLNDVNRELQDYLDALTVMFKKCKTHGVDAIFMTPNMLNTYVADDTSPVHLNYAKKTAAYQNEGRFDMYIAKAIEVANKEGIPVCDCYAKWKELSLTQDTTMLLANRINHPIKEMHELFAQSLFEMIFDEPTGEHSEESTMYQAGKA